MARLRKSTPPENFDIRANLAADLRTAAEWIYPAAGCAGADAAGWLREADALDAGHPVVLAGWRVANYVDGPYPAMVPAFRIESDGSVTAAMRTIHDGDTVDWEPDPGPALWRTAARPHRTPIREYRRANRRG